MTPSASVPGSRRAIIPPGFEDNVLAFPDGRPSKKKAKRLRKESEEGYGVVGVMRDVVQVMGANGNAVVHHNENEDFGREVVNVVNCIDNVRLREQTKLRILQLVFDVRFGEM